MEKKIIIITVILSLTVIPMGVLDKLFNKTKSEERMAIRPSEAGHQEEWEVYFGKVNDELSSIVVDLGFYKIAPLKDKPDLVWISIRMNHPYESGLSSQEESGVLNDIEETLVGKMTSTYQSTYVGRLTSAGERYLYFYSGDTALYDKAIADVMVSFPKYQFAFGAKEDKEWSVYFDLLYPSPQQLQQIQNRRVVLILEKNGDDLTKEREVFHWIYFKSKADREKYIDKIKDENFTVVDTGRDKSDSKFSYRLKIKRVDKVDLNSVDEYVIHLWQLAKETNGEYDGWETSVEKE